MLPWPSKQQYHNHNFSNKLQNNKSKHQININKNLKQDHANILPWLNFPPAPTDHWTSCCSGGLTVKALKKMCKRWKRECEIWVWCQMSYALHMAWCHVGRSLCFELRYFCCADDFYLYGVDIFVVSINIHPCTFLCFILSQLILFLYYIFHL